MKLAVCPGSHGISAAWLVRRRTALSRLDVLPWVVIHAVAYSVATNPAVVSVLESFSLPMIMSVSFVAHALCLLGQSWSVSWYFFMRFHVANALVDADGVFVEPMPHAGSSEIVPLIRKVITQDQKMVAHVAEGEAQPPLSTAWLGLEQLGFSYQSCLFDIVQRSGNELTVSRLVLPDACELNRLVGVGVPSAQVGHDEWVR